MNRVILSGNLATSPASKTFENRDGKPVDVCQALLAVNKYRGQKQIKADFFIIKTFNGTARFLSKYFDKGSRVLCQGYLNDNSYTDAEGKKRYMVEVIVEQLEFAGKSKSKDENEEKAAPSEEVMSEYEGALEDIGNVNYDLEFENLKFDFDSDSGE